MMRSCDGAMKGSGILGGKILCRSIMKEEFS